MSVSLTVEEIILLTVFQSLLLYAFILFLVWNGFFDFLYSWPLVLSYLFFLLLTVLIREFLNVFSMFIFSFISKERRCVRRFLRLVCIFEAPKVVVVGLGGMAASGIFFVPVALWRPEAYRHEMQHVKDSVADAFLSSVGDAAVPFAVLVLKGVYNGVYPLDVAPFFAALFPWTFLWIPLVKLMSEFRAFRYAEGLSFKETLQKLTLYAAEKKFGSTVFQGAVATLAIYWGLNVVVALFKGPPVSFYHFIAVLLVSVATTVVLTVVLGRALDVFTRRLFGEALGKFLLATFVAGAVFHPLLGVFTSFLFSWAMFGRARDAAAAAAVAAPSLLAVLLPGLIWTSVSSL